MFINDQSLSCKNMELFCAIMESVANNFIFVIKLEEVILFITDICLVSSLSHMHTHVHTHATCTHIHTHTHS